MSVELSAGELDCLATLWEAHATGEPALKLSEIHDRIGKRRARTGEASPALTTVSSYLRTLLLKGFVKEVIIEDTAAGTPGAVRTRGVRGVLPPTRSPRTGYQAAQEPGAVLAQTFKTLADAYPPEQRLQALVDFARALELPEDQRGVAVVELARALGLPDKSVQKLEKAM
jgi:hypothetical protein